MNLVTWHYNDPAIMNMSTLASQDLCCLDTRVCVTYRIWNQRRGRMLPCQHTQAILKHTHKHIKCVGSLIPQFLLSLSEYCLGGSKSEIMDLSLMILRLKHVQTSISMTFDHQRFAARQFPTCAHCYYANHLVMTYIFQTEWASHHPTDEERSHIA